MPGPLLRSPGPLRNTALRGSVYDSAYANMRNEADDVAAEGYNTALLNTTRHPLPDPVMPEGVLTSTTLPGIERKPVQGTPVFGSDEEFVKAKQEASTLADTTPLGQFTPYRPGFKADTTLKAAPAPREPQVLTSSSSDWETAFPGVRSNSSDTKQSYREAIASIESRGGGDYKAVGPEDPELGRALGRYQVMEANIGPWTKEALGRELSPEQFLSSPKVQDIVFDHIFGGYVERFGSPEKAAQAWFAGPGGVGKTTRKDVLGTSVGEYERKFMKVRNDRQ